MQKNDFISTLSMRSAQIKCLYQTNPGFCSTEQPQVFYYKIRFSRTSLERLCLGTTVTISGDLTVYKYVQTL